MVAKNDITGDSIQSKHSSLYVEKFDNIFRKDYVVTYKLGGIEGMEYVTESSMIRARKAFLNRLSESDRLLIEVLSVE
jgi:hypothetical protein